MDHCQEGVQTEFSSSSWWYCHVSLIQIYIPYITNNHHLIPIYFLFVGAKIILRTISG